MIPKENNILSNNSYKYFHSAEWCCYMGRIHLFLIDFVILILMHKNLEQAVIKKDLVCTEDQFCE